MKPILRNLLFAGALGALILVDLPIEAPVPVDFVNEAVAIIGIPITPFSVAGVARRTTRRAVAFSATAAVTGAAAASTSPAAPPPAPAQPAPAPAAAPAAKPAGAPPVGAIVTALPQGCVSSPKGGVEYYNCSGVYYRPAFQGNNLVYVVQNPG